MNIKSAKYFKATVYGGEKDVSVLVTLQNDTVWSVPLNASDNTHWIELQEWVKEGNTIEESD
jgi:hypothetical protein